MLRPFVEWAVLSLWVGLLLARVPARYDVAVRYDIQGRFRSLAGVPPGVETAARALAGPGVRCAGGARPSQVLCTIPARRRSEAREAGRLLTELLPLGVGFTSTVELRDRLGAVRLEAARQDQELRSLETEQASLAEQAEIVVREVAAARKGVERLETDLENRKRQRDLLEEALAKGDLTARNELFQRKRDEVTAAMAGLEAELATARADLTRLSEPLERKIAIEKRRLDLAAERERTGQRIATYEDLLELHGGGERFPDPDGFQLKTVEPGAESSPVRSLPEPVTPSLLALLLLALARRNPSDLLELETYDSAEEFSRETGLVCRGQIPSPN